MINIDENKCIGCSKCQKFCPSGLIEIQNKKAIISNTGACILCGHCQAICPSSAISLLGIDYEDNPAYQNVEYNDIKNLIKSNRSIRRFKENLVEETLIMDILQTLEYTASAKNEQPVKWVLVNGYDNVKEISNISVEYLKQNNLFPGLIEFVKNVRNPITVDAPHLLIAYTEANAVKPYDDCMIKMSMATILMHTKKIGSCYLGFLADFINNSTELKEYLNITKSQTVYSVIGFGYSDEVYSKLPTRKKPTVTII